MRWTFLVIASLALGLAVHAKPRLLVLTDIGQDPDDLQSLIRLLVYANEFEIEGLIATSDNNYKHEPPTLHAEVIRDAIERYGLVRSNLVLHDAGYPTSESLMKTVKSGNDRGGAKVAVFETIGLGRDTEGSEWIIHRVDAEDERPLNVSVWGGTCDLAQALWKVRAYRSKEEVDAFVKQLRVYAIGAQDSTSAWIRAEFPDLFYIHALSPEGSSFESSYRGIFLGGDYSTLSREWLDSNVRRDHGPLGAFYPPRAFTQNNPHGAIKEGDTPSWFYFLENGLQEARLPQLGGWGGRFDWEGTVFGDQKDTVDGVTSYRATVWRWRPAFQADFAARMDWCVEPYANANHPPIAVLNGDESKKILNLKSRPGEPVLLSAARSRDPDRGDTIRFRWSVYPEAGSYSGQIRMSSSTGHNTAVFIPSDAGGASVHVVLEVMDSGSPVLTSYRRAIICCPE